MLVQPKQNQELSALSGKEAGSEKFRSPLRYPGGKQKAIKQIAEMLPTSFQEYREPMCGGGSVFFHVRSHNMASSYWLNDAFPELVAFWKTVQNPAKCEELVSELYTLRAQLRDARAVKRYFLKARIEKPTNAYRKALLFFFFNRVTFSGTTRAGGFSNSAATRRFTLSSIARLCQLPEALTNANITCGDFENVIQAPGRDVFIFLDPPYYTANRLYGHNGSLHQFDHERLSHMLKRTPHRFLITYDDCREIRDLYRWAKIQRWTLQYGMNNCNVDNTSKIGSELFITNYDAGR